MPETPLSLARDLGAAINDRFLGGNSQFIQQADERLAARNRAADALGLRPGESLPRDLSTGTLRDVSARVAEKEEALRNATDDFIKESKRQGFPKEEVIGNEFFVKNSEMIDVVNDTRYLWTSNTSPAARALCPTIKITCYQQTKGQLAQALGSFVEGGFVDGGLGLLAEAKVAAEDVNRNFGRRINADVNEPYRNLYDATRMGSIILPYFSPGYAAVNSEFDSILNTLGPSIKGVGLQNAMSGMYQGGAKNARKGSTGGGKAGFAAELIKGTPAFITAGIRAASPGISIEMPHTWASTSKEEVSLGFNLYNTIGGDDTRSDAMVLHKELVDALISISSVQKFTRFGLTLAPMICEYNIPGIKWCPVAYLNVKVESLGQLTNIPGTNITVPDGYQIVLTLKDLVIRSRNLHNLQGPNTTVKAITDRVRVAQENFAEAEEELEIAQLLEQAAIQNSNEAKQQEDARRAAAQAAAEKEANDN